MNSNPDSAAIHLILSLLSYTIHIKALNPICHCFYGNIGMVSSEQTSLTVQKKGDGGGGISL